MIDTYTVLLHIGKEKNTNIHKYIRKLYNSFSNSLTINIIMSKHSKQLLSIPFYFFLNVVHYHYCEYLFVLFLVAKAFS